MSYANPYIVCDLCKKRATDGSIESGRFRNIPCGHAADFHSVCPSWGPVDDCQCIEHLGRRDHGNPLLPESADV